MGKLGGIHILRDLKAGEFRLVIEVLAEDLSKGMWRCSTKVVGCCSWTSRERHMELCGWPLELQRVGCVG